MASTIDYDRVGTKQFFVELWGAIDEAPFYHCFLSEYHKSKTAAQRSMREAYGPARAEHPELAIWGEIRQGEWRDSSFEDSEYGWIRDAEFIDEGFARAYAQPGRSGNLTFEWEQP